MKEYDRKKKASAYFVLAGAFAILLTALTVCLCFADRREAGPIDTVVGLATLNGAVFELTGVNYDLYELTELLGYLTVALAAGLALILPVQRIKRKSIKKVDRELICMVGLWIAVVAVYVIFELISPNCRPVLMPDETAAEASFPSSHTLMALCVLIPAATYLARRIKTAAIRIPAVALCPALASIIAVCRLLSGAHWFTDIVGGVLIAGALLSVYYGVLTLIAGDECRE